MTPAQSADLGSLSVRVSNLRFRLTTNLELRLGRPDGDVVSRLEQLARAVLERLPAG